MKALWTALVLLASPLPLLAEVTREEVRRLLDAHVSETTIMAYVQRNGPMEAMSVEDLGELKGAGASDNLLKALIQAQASTYGQAPSPSTEPSYPDSTTPYDYSAASPYDYSYASPYDAYPYYSAYYPYSYPYSYPY